MKFRVYNHNAPPTHKFQNVVLDATAHPDAFSRLVITATGGGLSAQATSKAMRTSAKLMTLLPGQDLHIVTTWLDLDLQEHRIDISLTRLDD